MSQIPICLINGVRIYYEDRSQGEPIILLHHLAGSSRSWKYVSYDLSQYFRTIIPDLRGHGRSEIVPHEYLIEDFTNDIRGLIEVLNINNPILIGHSLGSLIALDYALKYPTRALVLIGALVKAPNKEQYERYVSIALRYSMRGLAEYRRRNGDFSRYLTENPKVWEEFLSIYSENTPLGFKYAVNALLNSPDFSSRLSEINIPTLVIYGSEDRFISNLNIFISNINKLKYEIFEGYGHFLNFENPRKLSEVITKFLFSLLEK